MSDDTVIGKNIKQDKKFIYLLITIVMIYAYCHIIQMEYLLRWLIHASIFICIWEQLPCTGSSQVTEDDSAQDDASEYHRKRIVDPVAFCQDLLQYQVPCEPDRRLFAPRQQSNFQDFGLAPAYQQVWAGTRRAARPVQLRTKRFFKSCCHRKFS